MILLNHPTGLQNGQQVRFTASDGGEGRPGLHRGMLLTVREPVYNGAEVDSLSCHYRASSGREYVWVRDERGLTRIVQREEIEAA